MGNAMICGIRRRRVEERLTRPQRLVRQPSNVDYKRLRKLILSHKLAPCFDAVEAEDLGCVTVDVEECPICFLYYPSLNRSKCCTKGICTECFLQMKPSVAAHPAQCPFCKTSCYAVEYRGARTEKEKCLEQVEEQKFIEAKIRMQSESDNVRHQTRIHEVGNSISNLGGALVGLDDSRDARSPQMQESFEENGSSFSNTDSTRHEEFAVDLEGIMMMEAIWQSLQDARLQEKIAHEVYGSSNTVQSEIGKQGSCKNRHCFSQDSSAECSILEHQIPRIEYRRSQSHRGPYVDSFEESDVTSSEVNSFASSSNSINFASTLGGPLGSLLRVNGDAGQSSCHYTGLTIREQPFMLDTESKA